MNQVPNARDFAPATEDADTAFDNLVNVAAEQEVIGSILMNNEILSATLSFLEAEDFYEPIHQEIFQKAKDLIERSRTVNPVTIRPFLDPRFAEVGEMTIQQYMARLSISSASPNSAPGTARVLRDLSQRRNGHARCIDAANAFLNMQASENVSTIADEVTAEMMGIKAMAPRGDGKSDAGTAVDRFLGRVFGKKKPKDGFVPFPFPEFASVVQSGGWEPGNLYGLLASSGEGKSSLMLQIMRAALNAGHPTLLLSYDQEDVQVVMQMASQARSISMWAINRYDESDASPTLSQTECDWLAEEVETIRQLPMSVERLKDEKIGQIARYVDRFCRYYRKRRRPDGSEWGTPLIILDHNRKVTPDDPRAHEGRIAGSVNGAGKAMAGEHGAAVLFLNQRNGGGARRDVPRPIAADLFGGEQAREDYDAILYLYRAERWMKEKLKVAGSITEVEKIRARFRINGRDPENLAELGALKVRYGQDDVTEVLKWEGRYTRYSSERQTRSELF